MSSGDFESVNDSNKKQAPALYAVMSAVSDRVPGYSRWRDALSEFLTLTTSSQSDPEKKVYINQPTFPLNRVHCLLKTEVIFCVYILRDSSLLLVLKANGLGSRTETSSSGCWTRIIGGQTEPRGQRWSWSADICLRVRVN